MRPNVILLQTCLGSAGWLVSMNTIDFSCNVNPLGPPKGLLNKVDLEKLVSSYPDFTNQEAIKSLCEHYALQADSLAVGVGSTEFFFTIPEAFDISTGVVVVPAFWEYETSLRRAGKKVLHFETQANDAFQIDFDGLRKLLSTIKNTAHALYIGNPNNPTSALTNPKDILKLCEEFPETKVIVDETYLLFRPDYDKLSLMGRVSEHTNLIVVTSFSKFFTIPGVRIGVCCSSQGNIEAIKKHQIPYGVNNLAQALIPYVLESSDFIRESREFMENERRRVYELAKGNPHLQPYEPQANFMLVRLRDEDVSSEGIVDYLKQKNLIVRDGSEFSGLGKKYIRFSIRGSEDNNLLLKTITNYHNSKTKPS